MSDRKKGNIFLLLSALIWGAALIAQKEGMNYLGPFSFTAIRCLLGGISMLPVVWYVNRDKKYEATEKETVKGAFICGVFLTGLIIFQQMGLPHTSIGKAAFITAMYIPITPLLQRITGKKVGKNMWAGVAVAIFGMYLLTMTKGFSSLNFGDMCMLGAAVTCSFQILAVDKCVKRMEPVKLSCYQFIAAGLICIPFAVMFETVTWQAISDCAVPILYAGLASCGIGYTFQVVGQKYTPPAQAAILLSTETVFSLVAGMIFYHEVMLPVEYIGCAVMFIAIMVSQKE